MEQVNDISYWWCCIGAAEAGVLRTTLEAFVLTLGVGLPIAIWDAEWTLSDHNSSAYKDAWLGLFRGRVVTTMEDDAPIDVVTAQIGAEGDWLLWAAFLLLPAAACLDGCTQSRRPTP